MTTPTIDPHPNSRHAPPVALAVWDDANDRMQIVVGNAAGEVLTRQPTGARSASASFTPIAASHVAGDVNGAAQEFASLGSSGGQVMITSATILVAGGTAEATAWRLHLYSVTPPSALADDAAWDLPSGDRASYLGFVDLGTATDVGSTLWGEVHGTNKHLRLSGTSLFGYLVNLTTLTPQAVAHTVTLHTVELT